MALLGFKKRFVTFILSGRKKHTIRAKRAKPFKIGEPLYCYVGLRQPGAKRIGVFLCTKVERIEVRRMAVSGMMPHYNWDIRIDDNPLDMSEIQQLARKDGFKDFAEMQQFWNDDKREFPFVGDIVHWGRKLTASEVRAIRTRIPN